MFANLFGLPPETDVELPDGAGKSKAAQRSWRDAFASPVGGRERRRIRRARDRGAAKQLQVLNRRRFRQHKSNLMAASTLGNQVRIYDGLIGTERQRARITAQFTQQARALGQPLDDVVDALRTGLGLKA